MALLKLRTEPGNFKKNNGKSRSADLLQRVPTARSLQSVNPSGEAFRLAAADTGKSQWPNFPTQTPSPATSAVSKCLRGGGQRQDDLAFTVDVKHGSARRMYRGPYEL